MAMMQNIKSKNERFIFNIENKLIPELNEEFDCIGDNDKIEYSLYEIKEILETDSTTDYIYSKLKNLLLDTEIGLSIKRIPNNTKLIFFKKSNLIKRESDIFKLKIEKILSSKSFINYLNENGIYKVSVDGFKNVFDFDDYDTMTLYKKIKHSLTNSEIDISVTKNVLYEKEIIDIFKFYYKKDYNTFKNIEFKENVNKKDVSKDSAVIEEEIKNEIIEKEEYANYLKESDKIDKEEDLEIKNNVVSEGAELIKNYIIPNIETFKCPNCKKGILKCPEIECPICKVRVLEKWD